MSTKMDGPCDWLTEKHARLIAVAPELLAHARTVAFHLRRGDHKQPGAVAQMIDALEAVIAKAEGSEKPDMGTTPKP